MLEGMDHVVAARGITVKDASEDQPVKRHQYLLAALIMGMAVTASLLITRIPPFFSSAGGDPVTAGLLAFFFIVFAVGARIVRPTAME
ncbi:hypothetical protein [Egicoccus halophilus]|uniref:Uncharacterized protein n=1 Tax=Egicoccus halophilus TaxID=1670830 RepID=A0A8J3EY94_9ACTN|nr:hypothetical protein [Egicoccus halophilus]GGI07425.1 hypothetical protein GCM10011354_24020 [Egicoccus halophilus]